MILGGLLLVVGASLADHDWDEVQRRLAQRGPERQAMLDEVLEDFEDADFAELLRRLPDWAPGARLGLRQRMLDRADRRGVLLDEALAGSALARELLVAQLVARLDLSEPWSDGVRAHRDRADALTPPGLRVQFWSPGSRRLSLAEYVELLSESGAFAAPVVVHPAAPLEEVGLRGDGLPRPAEWWLEESLVAADCEGIRLLRSYWIAPRSMVHSWREGEGGEGSEALREVGELELHARLRRTEARAFESSLRRLADREPERARFEARVLCERLGLPVPARDPAARIVALAAGRSRDALPALEQEQGPQARRWFARALVVGGSSTPESELRAFAEVRRDPGGAAARALAWIDDPAAWAPDLAPGLRSLLREQPARLDGIDPARLPWSLAREIAPGRSLETLGSPAPAECRGDALIAALEGDRAARWMDFLAREGRDAQFLETLETAGERLLSGGDPAAYEQLATRLRWSMAARVDEAALLAGQTRALLRRQRKGAEGAVAAALDRQAEGFWSLGSGTRPADWRLDLDHLGWLPR